jgi:hypothetical protein
MSVLHHPAFSRLWYGGAPPPAGPNATPTVGPAPGDPNAYPNAAPNVYPALNPNALALHNEPERSHSPHSVDGGTTRPRRKNRERRGTENSLPVTFDVSEITPDFADEFRKGRREFDRDTIGGEQVKRQPKLESTADYQVPFPQVQDMSSTGNNGLRGRRESRFLLVWVGVGGLELLGGNSLAAAFWMAEARPWHGRPGTEPRGDRNRNTKPHLIPTNLSSPSCTCLSRMIYVRSGVYLFLTSLSPSFLACLTNTRLPPLLKHV